MTINRALFESHVYGIIFDSKGKVLFVKSVGGMKKYMFPGGTMSIGESILDGLKREIKEETNLDVEIVAPVHVEALTFQSPPQLAIYYICKNPKGEFKISSEHNEYVWEFPNKFDAKLIAHPSLLEIAKKSSNQ